MQHAVCSCGLRHIADHVRGTEHGENTCTNSEATTRGERRGGEDKGRGRHGEGKYGGEGEEGEGGDEGWRRDKVRREGKGD